MKCCVCLCVYNSSVGLRPVLRNILAIRDLFAAYRILVYYDQSADDSLAILQAHANTYGDMDIHKGIRESTVRTENIANARNGLLDMMRASYADYDYFMMMDTNEYSCVGDIRPAVIRDILARDDWDAISFDREAGYYDTWALSFDPFVYSFFHFKEWRRIVELMRERFTALLEEGRKKPDELLTVWSAFNGFAIYRTAKFLGCSYGATIDLALFPAGSIRNQIRITGCSPIPILNSDCEHRRFHLEAAKAGARIRISVIPVFDKVANPVGLRGPA